MQFSWNLSLKKGCVASSIFQKNVASRMLLALQVKFGWKFAQDCCQKIVLNRVFPALHSLLVATPGKVRSVSPQAVFFISLTLKHTNSISSRTNPFVKNISPCKYWNSFFQICRYVLCTKLHVKFCLIKCFFGRQTMSCSNCISPDIFSDISCFFCNGEWPASSLFSSR